MTKETRLSPCWHFIDDGATFALTDPHKSSFLYLPLVNEAGLKSTISPTLHGDIKSDRNSSLTPPTTSIDLHNSRTARNFWLYLDEYGPWSASGNSARQMAHRFMADAEEVTATAGFLWHRLTRINREIGLKAESINFVPVEDDQVELMQVTLTNISESPLTMTATAAIPIFGRPAKALQNHHMASLLHRTATHSFGVLVRPVLTLGKAEHVRNELTYGVLGTTADGAPPVGFFPMAEQFTGEGGNLEWPEAVVSESTAWVEAGEVFAGRETVGALRFDRITLEPGQSQSYVLIMAIMRKSAVADDLIARYGGSAQFAGSLDRNRTYWQRKLETPTFMTGDGTFDRWMKWVAWQPQVRRMWGDASMPFQDYDRGGRGWRTLWQDAVVQLMSEPDDVADLLWNQFAGVRFDGSNGLYPGAEGNYEADEDDSPQVWMDHGVWPFLATKLYVEYSSDLTFLLRNQVYLKDRHINRCQWYDHAWKPSQGTELRTSKGRTYLGSILEHILVQHLCAFFNVGQHNCIRLESGDWLDGVDMAAEKGESAAFTALYGSNLQDLSQMLYQLIKIGVTEVELANELLLLLDSLAEPVDYDSVTAKQKRLAAFFASCRHTISDKKSRVSVESLAQDLAAKAAWLSAHMGTAEWIQYDAERGWFNGYYDRDGVRVGGGDASGPRLTLTGQVFTLLGGIASDAQAEQMIRAVDSFLLEPAMGGHRLNNDFGDSPPKLGRCCGYAFGHRENGAVHLPTAVLWAKALYQRGFVEEGYQVLERIYRHCCKFESSRIYPGLPEYIDEQGRGVTPYLTGAADLLLQTMLMESFGVQGEVGCIRLKPQLMAEQFDAAGKASVLMRFGDKKLQIIYQNAGKVPWPDYQVKKVSSGGHDVGFERQGRAVKLPRSALSTLEGGDRCLVEVELG